MGRSAHSSSTPCESANYAGAQGTHYHLCTCQSEIPKVGISLFAVSRSTAGMTKGMVALPLRVVAELKGRRRSPLTADPCAPPDFLRNLVALARFMRLSNKNQDPQGLKPSIIFTLTPD